MKFTQIYLMAILLIIFTAPAGYAGQNMAREVATNCKVELDTYCKDVTPGAGRKLACLHAYSDKLSDACRETLLDAIGQVNALKAALFFIKDECADDLHQFCKDVTPGQGRLMNCLDTNDTRLSQRCRSALKDVGLRE
jgi:Cysteine rich repeat